MTYPLWDFSDPPDKGSALYHTTDHMSVIIFSIDNFMRRNRCELPVQINDVAPSEPNSVLDPEGPRNSLDGWGMPFSYSRSDNGFELRSPGSDRTVNTNDDVIITWHPGDTLRILRHSDIN